jgi:hypothetical protein
MALTAAQGVELGNMINNGAMQWYSLVTQKKQQASLMRDMFGSDFSQQTTMGQAAAPWGLILGGLVIVAAVVLIVKK